MRDLIDIVDTAQLEEAVGQSLLYHGTDPQSAEAILHFGKIERRTEHLTTRLVPDKNNAMRQFDMGFKPTDAHPFTMMANGVSLTRDPRFARKWKSGEGVVFALDRDKIVHRHRLVKVAFYGSHNDEAEEFLVGDLVNVDDYIVHIEMTQKTFDELTEIDDNYDDEHKQFLTLLRHRKLVILPAHS